MPSGTSGDSSQDSVKHTPIQDGGEGIRLTNLRKKGKTDGGSGKEEAENQHGQSRGMGRRAGEIGRSRLISM